MRNQSYLLRVTALLFFMSACTTGDAQTNYYSKPTGNLNLTSSWGTGTTGAGTAPANFTAANQVFNVRNNVAPTIASSWTVSGTNSKIIVGDGTNACNFQIPAGFAFTGKADVSSNGTLSIANATIPTLGTLSINSTVNFNGTAAQAIPVATYWNLTYSGSSTGTMAGGCTIGGTLSVSSGMLVLDKTGSGTTYAVGSMNVTTSQYVDFGSVNGTACATVNLSGDLSQSGPGKMFTSAVSVPNGIVNFTGASQHIQAATSYYIDYNVLFGSVCTLSGNFSFDGAPPTWPTYFTVNSGATLDCGNYSVLGSGVSTHLYSFFTLNSGANLITANTAGIASAGATGAVQTITRTFSSAANYIYDGTAAQVTGLFTTSPIAATMNNCTINNAAGVTLSQAETVNGLLSLISGLLNTTATNLITVNNAGSVTGASGNSFVNGPVKKIGSQAFVFPVGVSGTGYIPIGISAPSSVTDAFQAQYIRSGANLLGAVTATGLNHVSACDYWILNHVAGSSAVNVTGYWNTSNPCGGAYVNSLATVALAHFNGTSWNAWGNSGGVTGATAAGSVTWNNVSTFSPFALSSTSVFNPLPVNLVGFDAEWKTDGTVGLSWKTEQELNSNHFIIQRSADGASWQSAGTLAAKGSSSTGTDYSFTDASPLPILDYYRLQIVDNDGGYSYSGVREVSGSQKKAIRIFPNPARDHVNIYIPPGSLQGMLSIRLLNVDGRVLLQKELSSEPGGETISLPVGLYPPGNYPVQVWAPGQAQRSVMLVIKRE